MPTPLGHALAGLAIGWLASRPEAGAGSAIRKVVPGLTGLALVLAVAPDLDILAGTHRAASHSLGTAAAAGLAGFAAAKLRSWPAARLALVCALAWGSHAALDWLGKDSSPPRGVMALWPFSAEYFVSGLDVFAEVSRRYWLPKQFIVGNLASMAREVVILGPLAWLAWRWHRKQRGNQREHAAG